jgi:hypothetical protein
MRNDHGECRIWLDEFAGKAMEDWWIYFDVKRADTAMFFFNVNDIAMAFKIAWSGEYHNSRKNVQ